MIRALIILFCFILVGCTSNETTVRTQANLTKYEEVFLPPATFKEEQKYKQLLTTTYGEKKRSIIVFLNLYKDKLELSGVSPSFINIFKLTYDKNGINTEYYIPKTMAPPVNQVLLDILLCYSDKAELIKIMPKNFVVLDTDTKRIVEKADKSVAYEISYLFKDNKRLATKIENKEFNYSLSIKYL